MSPEVEVVGGIVTPLTTVSLFKKRVMLVCPWLKHVHPVTAFCVAQLADKRRTSMMLNYGDAFVAHSRNTCADLFLKSDLEYMLTVDDDMLLPFGNSKFFNAYMGYDIPEPFCSYNVLDRLMSHKKTLIGALYFGRSKTINWPLYGEGKAEIEYARGAPYDCIKQTRWVGTGCLLIHRSVFEDIEKRFPHLGRGPNGMGGHWFSTSEHNLLDHVHRTHKFLATGPMTGEKSLKAYEMLEGALRDAKRQSCLGCGEDVQFSLRATESGHPVFIDFGAIAGHIGYHTYGPRQ